MHIIERFIDEIMNQTKPDKPIWNIEKIKAGQPPKWNYVDGCVLLSFIELYQVTQDEKYFNFVKSYIDYYLEDTVPLGYKYEDFNLDNINEGKVLFFLYEKTNDPKYKKTLDLLYKQVQNQPRTKEGNFWHKKIYPNQVWLDGLYMAMPFYTMYETKFNKLVNYKDIYTQISNIRKLMFNTKDGLYYHGYDAAKSIFWANKETGLSENYWLRSIGWFAACLVDVLDEMDERMFFEYRAFRNQLKELIDGTLPYLNQDHLWYQVVNINENPDNYSETSGSAMLSYAILKAVRLNLLPPRYLEYGKKVFDGIVDKYLVEEENQIRLCGICLVAGLGPSDNHRRNGTIEYYLSEKVVCNDGKGIAPFLLAYKELKCLKIV